MNVRQPQSFTYAHAATILDTKRNALLRCLRENDALEPDGYAPKQWVIEAGYISTHDSEVIVAGLIHKKYRTGRVTVQGLAWLDRLLHPQAKAA